MQIWVVIWHLYFFWIFEGFLRANFNWKNSKCQSPTIYFSIFFYLFKTCFIIFLFTFVGVQITRWQRYPVIQAASPTILSPRCCRRLASCSLSRCVPDNCTEVTIRMMNVQRSNDNWLVPMAPSPRTNDVNASVLLQSMIHHPCFSS